MRVIFLDLDGVICLLPTSGSPDAFDYGCVGQLNRILNEYPDVKLVISSAWRLLWPPLRLRDHFEQYGIDPLRIVGHTPHIPDIDSVRGDEIAKWLAEHPVDDFVILDDDGDMGPLLPKLFRTKFRTGLTAQIADDIIGYF